MLKGFASLSLNTVAYSLSVIFMTLHLNSNEKQMQRYLSFPPNVLVQKLCGHGKQVDLTLCESKASANQKVGRVDHLNSKKDVKEGKRKMKTSKKITLKDIIIPWHHFLDGINENATVNPKLY